MSDSRGKSVPDDGQERDAGQSMVILAQAGSGPNGDDAVDPTGRDDDEPTLIAHDATAELDEEPGGGFEVIGRVVHFGTTPNFTDVSALLEPKKEVKPGQFLGVWHGRRGHYLLTVIQVANAREVNPNEEPSLAAAREALGLGRSYGREGVSTRIFRLAECATLEEFDLLDDNGIWRVNGEGRSPQALARSGDQVVLLPNEIVIAAIGGLPTPDDGIDVGKTYDAAGVPVVLSPTTFQLHIGVFGNPGRGKSFHAGNLIEEARAWDIPILVMDINGETIDAAKALGGLVLTLPDPTQFGVSLNLMTPHELVAITPNVQPGTQYAELIEIAHDRLRNESRGRPISFASLKERIEQVGESTKVDKRSVGAAIARVGTLEKDPLIGKDFDFVKKLEEHRLVVLDCRYLSLIQTRLIAAMGARQLQHIGREKARAADAGDKDAEKWFALYLVDEAHTVVPDDEKIVSTQVFYELARMGRHVRTGLILSSQSPQDLNPSVLKRLQMRFVFALERDQLRSIQGVLADLDDKIVQQLPKLPRGVCAVSGSSELIRHGFLLNVRSNKTPRGGRTPGVFTGRVKKLRPGRARGER